MRRTNKLSDHTSTQIRSRTLGLIVCCALALGITQSTLAGNSIHVPDDYASIQDAVDAALSGELILVQGGDYTELVTVTTEHLSIRAVAGARLTGSFIVLANGVSIENWHITTGGGHNQGLQTGNVLDVSIKNNTFVSSGTGIDYRGIWLNACQNCSVKNNAFITHRYDGISIFDDCTGTEIKNNFSADTGDGIRIWPDSVGSHVINNELVGNSFCGVKNDSGNLTHTLDNNRDDCTL